MKERRRDVVQSHDGNQGNTDHEYEGRMYGIRTLRRRISGEQRKSNPVTGCVTTRFRHHRVRTAFTLLIAVAAWSLIYLVIHTTWSSFKHDGKLRSHEEVAEQFGHVRNGNKDGPHVVSNENKSFTSAKTSTYQLLNEPIHGGFLHIHVQARDEKGHARTTGGDFWFATLSSKGSMNPPRPKGSTSGKVMDHNNGTYSVYFYLGWVGKSEINITLVHSNDAIRYLRNTYWKKDGKTIWNGYFANELESKHKLLPAKEKVSECTVHRNGQRKYECEYWFPQAMGQTVFACRKPHPKINCASLHRITHNFHASTRVTRQIAGNALNMFTGSKYATRVKSGVQIVDVLPGNSNTLRIISDVIASRPLCKPAKVGKEETATRLSDGFWYNGNWTSLICQATHWRDPSKIGSCLRSRELILSGDSTSRQWAVYITSVLHGIPIKMLTKVFKAHRYFPLYNFTLNFVFHPQVQTAASQTLNDVRYTVQILEDKLRRKCNNDVIVISPWAHFLQWSRESYQEKITLIRQAVEKYLYKCPKSSVVIKGPHARHARTLEERLYGSNYTAFEWGEVMRSTFAGSGAWYLDVWDMNLSFGSKINVHMPEAVVRQEIDMLLSYVCHNWA